MMGPGLALSKLFSGRTKDLDDLRILVSKIDKEALKARLKEAAADLLKELDLKNKANENWYILFGDDLPV